MATAHWPGLHNAPPGSPYTPTNDIEQADLILFNTCSVREKAQEKVLSDLGRVKHLKEKGVLIGVGGCVARQEGASRKDATELMGRTECNRRQFFQGRGCLQRDR